MVSTKHRVRSRCLAPLYLRHAVIHARVAESHADSESALYARAKSDQLLNIRLLAPLLIAINLVSAFAIWRWPDLFIARAGHVWLVSIQLASLIVYLVYVIRYFNAIAPLLLRSREGAGEK